MASPEHDDNEQMRLAIALSMQDQQTQEIPGPSERSPQSDEDVQEQMRLAIALSMQDKEVLQIKKPTGISTSETATGPLGLLGFDRRAMEQERLARKRKQSISPPPLARPSKVVKIGENGTDLSIRDVGQSQTAKLPTNSKTKADAEKPSALQYPKGVVKKTWSFGFDRGEDIKIEEVLQRADLQLAVLSSFQWDVEWLMSKVDTRTTKLIFVMQAKDEATKQQYRRETADMPNLKLCFPSMAGNVNCMHSKLMLLSYPTHLRVVVPTANLVPYDWGELGVIENSAFLIDLPRLPPGATIEDEDVSFFCKELTYFCRAMGLQQDIVKSLAKFDFSATGQIAFVHTIGGEHSGPDEPWRRTGYCGLGRAVSYLGLSTTEEVQLDFIASSLGAINMDLLSALYLAAQGDDGTTEYQWRTRPKSKSKSPDPKFNTTAIQLATIGAVETYFKLYFPSRDTILASRGGPNAAGPICFQKRWYGSPKFPKKVLQDCKSTRKGLLMHNKIIYVRPANTSPTLGSSSSSAPLVRPWAYIGSANCSESAWGRLVLDRTRKMPKLNCRNWECGVVLPVPQEAIVGSNLSGSLNVFKGTVPIPIEHPAQEMGSRQPWFGSAEELE